MLWGFRVQGLSDWVPSQTPGRIQKVDPLKGVFLEGIYKGLGFIGEYRVYRALEVRVPTKEPLLV